MVVRIERAPRRPCDGAARRERPWKRCRAGRGSTVAGGDSAAGRPSRGRRRDRGAVAGLRREAIVAAADRPAGALRPCGGRSDLAHSDRHGVRLGTIAYRQGIRPTSRRADACSGLQNSDRLRVRTDREAVVKRDPTLLENAPTAHRGYGGRRMPCPWGVTDGG